MDADVIEKRMREAEPHVMRAAFKYSSRSIPPEDMAQEIRIHLIGAIEGFDETKASFSTWCGNTCNFRAIDVIRKHGFKNRKGIQNKVQAKQFSTFTDDDEERYYLDPVCDASDHESLVDWNDLADAVSDRDNETKAVFLYVQGHPMAEVGRRLGICESRVSQIISNGNGVQVLRRLIDHEPRSRHAAEQRKEKQMDHMDIEKAIQIATGPDALKHVDEQIAAHEAALKRLKSFRKAIAPKSAASRNVKLNEAMEAAILAQVADGPKLPGDIAKAIDSTPIGVGQTVKASTKLTKDGPHVVAV